MLFGASLRTATDDEMALNVNSFGGADPAAVGNFEQVNQLELPSDYRQFLLRDNGGQLNSLACFIKGLNQGVLVDILLGLGQRERSLSSEYWLARYRPEMPPGFVVIALGATGMFMLGTRDPDVGVYFWDDAHVFKGSSEEGGNTYRVAATFTEFLNSLQPVE